MNKSINLKGKFGTASSSLITRDMGKLVEQTGNLYEAVSVISKRANQIAVMMKEELNSKLADFASTVDNLEEVHENREQIEISKYYERMPKPTSIATDEYMEGKLKYRYKDKE
ncbi:MAG: DNA-directed RNA polymerase subunit omega [Microscillaceae bacterium]|jgi:DNA-directed RNA polymerase subunit K/omega|nr:DNA-directed RNA polymerase subunit omega [Microscillaceae bacterium]